MANQIETLQQCERNYGSGSTAAPDPVVDQDCRGRRKAIDSRAVPTETQGDYQEVAILGFAGDEAVVAIFYGFA